MEQAVGWLDLLGAEPIADSAAVSGGSARGILAVAGTSAEAGATYGEDARAALAACAALAAIVFDRRPDTPAASEETPAAPVTLPVAPEEPVPAADVPADPFRA
jgi:hypothetical protein